VGAEKIECDILAFEVLMLTDIVRMLIDTLGALVVGACLLRLWLQWQRISMRNPVGEFTMVLTDWIVKPLRRVIPGTGGVDWSSLIAGYLVCLVAVCLLFLVSSMMQPLRVWPDAELIFGLSFIWLLKWAVWTVIVVLMVSATLSWFNPFSPVLPVFDALGAPVLRPIRRAIVRMFGSMGRFDFSPLVAVLVLYILLYVVQGLSLRWLGVY
jgi:YggT family protein